MTKTKAAAAKGRVWRGGKALEPLLVEIRTLDTFPGNPRRGDVEKIAESLSRFGQTRPILVDSKGRIIAGNHTYQAAKLLRWSHIAAVETDLSPDEAEAYLIADNHLSDLAGWDPEKLAPMLRKLALEGRLAGTGYSPEDVESYLWEMQLLAARAQQMENDVQPDNEQPRLDKLSPITCPNCGTVFEKPS